MFPKSNYERSRRSSSPIIFTSKNEPAKPVTNEYEIPINDPSDKICHRFYRDFHGLLADIRAIGRTLSQYCDLRARDQVTSVACLRIQRDVNELKLRAEHKNNLLQEQLGEQISNFAAEDGELKKRIDLLKDVSRLLDSMQSIVECASTLRCADFNYEVDRISNRVSGAKPSLDPTLLEAVNPLWQDRDSQFDAHIRNVVVGVENLETIALSIRHKNEDLKRVIQMNDLEADNALVELEQMQSRMKWVAKVLARSRFWCYLSLMTVIVLLSTSLGFLLRLRFQVDPSPSQSDTTVAPET